MKIPITQIKSLRQILNARKKSYPDLKISIIGYKSSKEKGITLIEMGEIADLAIIAKIQPTENFTRVRVDAYLEESLNSKPIYSKDLFPSQNEIPEAFSGLGMAEIERKVDELLLQKEHEKELTSLKKENAELIEHLNELEDELENYEETLEELNEKIKTQSNLKNYAELAGIALERLGLRNKVKDVLDGILGTDNNSDSTQENVLCTDQSGIIESNVYPQNSTEPQNELIELIHTSLKNLDHPTLGVVFSLFSEIEKNNHIGIELLNIVTQYKQNSTLNVHE